MTQVGQTLNSRQARRSMDAAVGEELRAATADIRADMGILRRALGCPEDAAGA